MKYEQNHELAKNTTNTQKNVPYHRQSKIT